MADPSSNTPTQNNPEELSPLQILNLYTSGALAFNLLLAFLFYTQPNGQIYRVIGIVGNVILPVLGTFVLIVATPKTLPKNIERQALTLTLIPIMALGLWVLSFMVTTRDSKIAPPPAAASPESPASSTSSTPTETTSP